MPYTRNRTLDLDETPSQVLDAVHRAIKANERYRSAADSADEVDFIYRPRGWPLFLQTHIRVTIQPRDAGSHVDLTTIAQAWIQGDIFGTYKIYLRCFDRDIRAQLATPAPPAHTN